MRLEKTALFFFTTALHFSLQRQRNQGYFQTETRYKLVQRSSKQCRILHSLSFTLKYTLFTKNVLTMALVL
jgi:hypothetical protein